MARDHRDDYWALLGPGCDRTSEWVMLYCLRRPCGVSDRPSAPLNSTCLSMLCAAYLRLMAKVTSLPCRLSCAILSDEFHEKARRLLARQKGGERGARPSFLVSFFPFDFLSSWIASYSAFPISWRSFRAFCAESAHLPWISVNFLPIDVHHRWTLAYFDLNSSLEHRHTFPV